MLVVFSAIVIPYTNQQDKSREDFFLYYTRQHPQKKLMLSGGNEHPFSTRIAKPCFFYAKYPLTSKNSTPILLSIESNTLSKPEHFSTTVKMGYIIIPGHIINIK